MLWLAFSRDMCAWQGQQQLWDVLVGEGETQGRGSSCLPANPCAHLTVARRVVQQNAAHSTQRPLSSAASRSPTPWVWVWVCARSTQGGPTITRRQETRGWVQPKTYHRLGVVLDASEARSSGATTFTVKVILKLRLQCPEIAPVRACCLPSSESCGSV